MQPDRRPSPAIVRLPRRSSRAETPSLESARPHRAATGRATRPIPSASSKTLPTLPHRLRRSTGTQERRRLALPITERCGCGQVSMRQNMAPPADRRSAGRPRRAVTGVGWRHCRSAPPQASVSSAGGPGSARQAVDRPAGWPGDGPRPHAGREPDPCRQAEAGLRRGPSSGSVAVWLWASWYFDLHRSSQRIRSSEVAASHPFAPSTSRDPPVVSAPQSAAAPSSQLAVSSRARLGRRAHHRGVPQRTAGMALSQLARRHERWPTGTGFPPCRRTRCRRRRTCRPPSGASTTRGSSQAARPFPRLPSRSVPRARSTGSGASSKVPRPAVSASPIREVPA